MSEVATSHILRSEIQSPKVFSCALETLPFPPFAGGLIFNVKDLPFLEYSGSYLERLESYIQDCSARGVIPFSELTLEYFLELRSFGLSNYHVSRPSDDRSLTGLTTLIAGGKASSIRLIINGEASFESIANNGLFDILDAKGYEPIAGQLLIATNDKLRARWSMNAGHRIRTYDAYLAFYTDDTQNQRYRLSGVNIGSKPGLTVGTKGNWSSVGDAELVIINNWFKKITDS